MAIFTLSNRDITKIQKIEGYIKEGLAYMTAYNGKEMVRPVKTQHYEYFKNESEAVERAISIAEKRVVLAKKQLDLAKGILKKTMSLKDELEK